MATGLATHGLYSIDQLKTSKTELQTVGKEMPGVALQSMNELNTALYSRPCGLKDLDSRVDLVAWH